MMLALSDPASQPTLMHIVLVGQYVLFGLGALTVLVWVIRLVRAGRWRQPLGDVMCTGQGPSFVQLLLIVGVYLTLQSVMIRTLLAGVDRETLLTPGTHASHSAATIDGGAKLLACLLISWFLARVRSFAPSSRNLTSPAPLSIRRMTGLALAGTLFILPLVALQLKMGQMVWQRLFPSSSLPVHPVFESLSTSDWGPVGVVQLFVMAIVVAPIAEELFFRGLVLQTFCRYTRSAWLAIVLSGIAFGSVHSGQPQAVLPLTTMGIVLAYLRVRFRSIELCILIHALFNAQAMVMAFLVPELVT